MGFKDGFQAFFSRISGVKSGFRSFFSLPLALLILPVLSGCDLFDNSMVEYFEDNTGVVGVTGAGGQTRTAVMPNGTILIPSSSEEPVTTIVVGLFNPRNYTVRHSISNSTGAAGRVQVRQTGPGEILVDIGGAAEGEEYVLTLQMQSPDGLRDFAPYTMSLKCVSFEASLLDFTVDGATPPDFDPNGTAFTAFVPNGTARVTLEGNTIHPEAALAVYAGADSSGTVLGSGRGKVTIPGVSLVSGNNYFYLVVTALSSDTREYTLRIYRGPGDAKAITAFSITSPVTAAGSIDEGSKTITVTVPYGTDVSAMTASVTYTGASISPAPGTARNFSSPQTYTVTAADGTTAAYTVTVQAAPSGAKAITAFTITSPVAAAGIINEGAKTITATVPYGTVLTAMTAFITHTGASINPAPGTANFSSPRTYTVTAADGTTANYTVTVSYGPGITGVISSEGIPYTISFSVSSSDVGHGSLVSVSVSGGTVSSWNVTINDPVTLNSSDSTMVAFFAPEDPGFYTVNVIAVIGGIPYSGYFSLMVQ
jgi:hypothetical protein